MSVLPLGPQTDNSLWVHMSNRMSVCLSVFIFAEDVKRVERPTNTKKIPICFGQETEIKLTRKTTHTQTHAERKIPLKYLFNFISLLCVCMYVCESECLILPQQDYMPLKEHRSSHKRYVFIQDLGQW